MKVALHAIAAARALACRDRKQRGPEAAVGIQSPSARRSSLLLDLALPVLKRARLSHARLRERVRPPLRAALLSARGRAKDSRSALAVSVSSDGTSRDLAR
jgi:hypothetical protein